MSLAKYRSGKLKCDRKDTISIINSPNKEPKTNNSSKNIKMNRHIKIVI